LVVKMKGWIEGSQCKLRCLVICKAQARVFGENTNVCLNISSISFLKFVLKVLRSFKDLEVEEFELIETRCMFGGIL